MSTNRFRILVVEDALDIQRLLRSAFESEEFEVQEAGLRRGSKLDTGSNPNLDFGDVVIDFVQRSVTKAGVSVNITPTEYRLLIALTRSPGKMLTQSALMREVWGPQFKDSTHYLRIYIGHLRRKLENDPSQPRHFITETGVGYRFLK